MKKILGLDIGTNSIGWALACEAELEAEESDILKTGVRIVAADTEHIRQYEQGKSVTLNADRRTKRGTRRRNIQRYKLRRKRLLLELIGLGLLPAEALSRQNGWADVFHVPDSLHLFELRDRAARGEYLFPAELGRVLFHLNQKRGYKSNRKAQNDEEKETVETTNKPESGKPRKKGLLQQIADREAILKENGWTVGQHFFHQLQADPNFRTRQQTFTREAFQQEFDRIWAGQLPFYPGILTEEARLKIRNEILYFQRPLKSAKHPYRIEKAGCPARKRKRRASGLRADRQKPSPGDLRG